MTTGIKARYAKAAGLSQVIRTSLDYLLGKGGVGRAAIVPRRLIEVRTTPQVPQHQIFKRNNRAGTEIFDIPFQTERLDLREVFRHLLTIQFEQAAIYSQSTLLRAFDIM